jgi:ATP-binding cassette subfamily B protein
VFYGKSTVGILVFLRQLLRSLTPYKGQCVLILGGLLLEMGFNGCVPLAFKYLIDYAITLQDKQVLVMVLGLLTVGVVIVAFVGLGRDYLYARVAAALLSDLRQRMFHHLQRLSMDYYARTNVGDILARFSTDLAAVEHAITAAIPWGILPALDVVFSTILLFTLEWRLASLAMLVFPLSLLGPRILVPRASAASYERQQQEAHVVTAVQEDLAAQPVIKAFGLEQQRLLHFTQRLEALVQSSTRVGFLSALVERSAGISILMLQVVVLGVGAYLTFTGSLSIGSLVSFQTLFLALSWSLSYVTQYVPNLVQASGGMQRIEELLRETPQVIDMPAAMPLPRLHQEICFEAVDFGYTRERRQLHGVHFTIRVGEFVAFVGPSGSGKSTILQLLTRFYDPVAGRVTLDGCDLRHVTQASLRAQCGIVFQESFLFNTTIRENIRVGKPGATDAEVEAAARAAELHDLIESMPEGYATVVGERGGRLSGGQRQRIAIARAMLRDPAILILDEATSALDAATEAAINLTLEHIGRGRTVIAVTHRLATVEPADRIFVLDHGRLVERGRHQELLAAPGVYAQLWEKQSGFVISDDGANAMVDAARLRAVPLLAELDEALRTEIARRFVTERFPADRLVVHEGDPGDKFYIIVRGSVQVTTETNGTERVLTILQDGDHFGEIALLQDVPRTATVRTRTASLFVALSREQLLRLMGTAPQLRTVLHQEIARRLARSQKQAERISSLEESIDGIEALRPLLPGDLLRQEPQTP